MTAESFGAVDMPFQNNPYCGFKDDKERRLALNVRARWYASAAIAMAFAGSQNLWMEEGIRWLMHWFH
jgi:hypothetical protein